MSYTPQLYAIKQLNVWYSKIGFDGAKDVMFQQKDPLKVRIKYSRKKAKK